MVRSSCCSPRR